MANRFIIHEGLPYLVAEGKAFCCRFDDEGFTVGDAVDISIPDVTLHELSIKAKCSCLDSIGKDNGNKASKPFDEMKLAELKAYAKERHIALGSARTKDEIIDAITEALI